jgi:hypothetical protein
MYRTRRGHNNRYATELACVDDQIWFDWNSNRVFRLRGVVTDEFTSLNALPEGMVWRVLVIQISRQVRARTLVALPDDLPTEGADDGLALLFKQAAPANVQKVAEAAKRAQAR